MLVAFGVAFSLRGSFREKNLVVSPTCAKLADMLLTKCTYTCLGGGLPLSRPDPSRASAAFPRDAFPQQSSRYNRIEERDEASARAQAQAVPRRAIS